MSIKRIAVFFSAFILVFASTLFFARAAGESLTATVGSACTVNLNWVPGVGVTPGNFEVRYTTNPNFNGTNTILNYSSTTRSAQVMGLAQATDYRFDIKGLYAPPDVTRTKSNPNVVKTDALPSRPGKPQNVSGSLDLVGGKLQTKINFGIPGTLSSKFPSYGGFSIKRDGVEISSSTLHATGLVYSFTDGSNGLVSTKKYVYDIAAFESDLGCGNTRVTSDTYSVTIPSAPSVVTANFVFDKLANTYETTVSWTLGTGQDSIELYRDGVLIKSLGGSVSSYKDVSAEPGQTYTYTVRGKHNSGGASAFAASNKITISNTPQNVRASVTSIKSKFANITITWDNTNPGENYIVKYGTSTTNLQVYQNRGFAFTSEQVPTIKIDGLPINKNYYFQVEFEDIGAPSEKVMVNTTIKYRLSGQAWSNIDGHGIGWVKFACDATDPNCGGQEFSVYIDGDGYLHGGAWTSVDVDGHGYGWLSFEKTHLTGCPQGTCAAKLMDNGEIRGWARFYNPSGQAVTGSYEWVALNSRTIENTSLSGIAPYSFAQLKDSFKSLISSPSFKDIWGVIRYSILSVVDVVKTYALEGSWGLEINPGSGGKEYVEGTAWGGDIIGWIAFSRSECNGLCDVVAEGGESFGKFRIKSQRTNLAPREQTKLWVEPEENVSWSTTLGTVSPDSNIATTTFTAPDMTDVGTAIVFASSTTEKASTTLTITKNPYQFYCTPDKGSINVEWIKEWSDPNYGTYANHMLILEYSTTTSPGGPWKSIKNPSIGSGVYTHSSLSTSTTYYYRLSAGYPTPSKVYYMYTSGCKPDAPVAENPSRLRVYAQNLTTLLLNWKDNATSSANYTFQVERIKLTPATTTQFGVTTTQAKVTSQTIPLTWKNITTSTPFDIWLERSSSTVNRFRNEDKASEIYPGCSTDAAKGDPACIANRTFHNTRPVVVTSTIPKKFTGVTSSVYLSDNVGREGEGTTFFYRIRACSSIVPKYTECLGSECSVNDQYRPKPACSLFNASSTDGKLVATTTPPLPVIKATSTRPVKTLASNHWNYDYSPYKTTLTWTDDSVRETGTIIQRNGLTAVKRGNAISFENIDLATTTLNPDVVKFGGSSTRGGTLSWEDNTLEAGEIYTYKIVPYYETTDPITGKFVRVISIDEAPPVEVRTAYRVIIGVDGDGAGFGYVTENLKNLNTRTGKVIADYEPEEQAQIEWNYMPPDTTSEKNVFFNTWNGVSGCTTQNPCNTSRLGKIYANAEFLKWCYNFTADVGGDGCGSVSIKSYTACQSPHTGGAYQRDTQIVVDHSDDTNACYFTNWSGSCSGTSDTCTVTINQNSLSAVANFGKYCFDYVVSVSPSICATPTVSGGTACPVQYSGGAYQKGSSLTAGYKDKLSTCNFSTWVGSPNIGYLQSDMSAQARFTTTTASSSSSSAHLGGIKLSQFGDQKSVVESLRVKISKLLVGDGTSKKSSPVSSFTASVYDAIASFASEIKNMIGGIFSAGAAYNANEDYFVIANVNPVTQPSFKDDKLEPDTVYYYRVGIKKQSGPIKWSMNDGSGKTLPDTAVNTTEKSPVCVRNSYCDFSLTKWVGPDILGLTKKESSEKQCKENSDCINVGRKRQTTEEQ